MSGGSLDVFAVLDAGDFDAVARTVTEDPSVARARNGVGVSLLLSVLYHRQRELAELILAQLDELDVWEVAALGRMGDLQALTERSHSALTNRSPDGFTALHLAAFFGHTELCAWMIKHGAPVDAIAANPMLVRPIHSAVAARSMGVVELLLNAGADPDAPQRGGWTALHAAAKHGDLAMVELLLSKRARRRVRSDNGQTPEDLAAEAGHRDVVERLQRATG